ncbi:MAG TPA: four helix bundle protein [Chryseosolibacter sp.]
MNSYRDLEIYQESRRLALEVHKVTLTLPKFEMYEEGSQARRCSKSVTSMIVEGYGRRRYKNDYVKYLLYSHSECDETCVHLDFLFYTGSWKDEVRFRKLTAEYIVLSKKINKFIQWVEDNL